MCHCIISADAFIYDFTVSGFHATKNAAGKEVVAKLVDDTYRFVFACCNNI